MLGFEVSWQLVGINDNKYCYVLLLLYFFEIGIVLRLYTCCLFNFCVNKFIWQVFLFYLLNKMYLIKVRGWRILV